MLALALAAQIRSNDIDWKRFELFVNDKVPVAKNSRAFLEAMEEQMNGFLKANPNADKGEFHPKLVFQVRGSSLFGFSIGNIFQVNASFVARPIRGRYHLEPIDQVKSADRFVPQHGVMSSGRLVVVGQEHVESNYMSPGAASCQFSNGHWKPVQYQTSKFQGTVDGFEYRNSKWSAEASGRTYPKNIHVPHSGAEVQMRRTFSVQKGRLANSPQKFFPCPMKTMDDLIHAVQMKNWSLVSSYCASPKIAKDLKAASAHAKKDLWWPSGSFGEDSLSCQIVGTDRGVTVERKGRGYKVTKLFSLVF